MSRAAAHVVLSSILLSCSPGESDDGGASGRDALGDGSVSVPAALSLTPSPVEFGDVGPGSTKVVAVLAKSISDSAVTVGAVVTSGSAAFRVMGVYESEPEGCTGLTMFNSYTPPFAREPGGDFCIAVQYEPSMGAQSGLLSVLPEGGGAPLATAALHAAYVPGEDDEIVVTPGYLNFGPVEVGTIKDLRFRIENRGSDDVTIHAVEKRENDVPTFEAISIVTGVSPGTVLAAGKSLEVDVRFVPLKKYPVTYAAIGYIEVRSNHPDLPLKQLKVLAQTATPKLVVTQSPLIDFGKVAENSPGSTRPVTFMNVGTKDLEVTGLAIENNAEGEFTIDEVVEDPMVIPPNDYRIVNLRYENTVAADGEVESATLVFASTDEEPDAPTSVELRATRAKEAHCVITVEPLLVNFGIVELGLEKSMMLNIKNVGTAPCSPFSVSVDDGPATPIPGNDDATCRVPNGDKSMSFFVKNEPPAIKDLLQPGQSLPLEIKFAPTGNIWSGGTYGGLTDYLGIVQVTMFDYYNPDLVHGTDYTVVSVPAGKVGDEVPCNLAATSRVPSFQAVPSQHGFGETAVGCRSRAQTFKVYQIGQEPSPICSIALEGCGANFALESLPTLSPCMDGIGGTLLTEDAPLSFDVVHTPQGVTPDGCVIVIHSSHGETPIVTIPLTGVGTNVSTQTDTFTQLGGQKVDLLFIVDSSGSMTDQQATLGSNIDAFVSQATQWQTDFHIGVVSTDVDPTNPQAGWLQTSDGEQGRFFTSVTGTAGFDDTVTSLAKDGSDSEQGFEAALRALSSPLTSPPSDPPVVCTKDLDCTKPHVCVPSILDPGTSVCAGWNWEFLRPDAILELVFVSDEDDGSPGNLAFYVDFFKSIKGAANTDLFHAHAIVGDEGSGCTSATGEAEAGDRYIALSQQTGGELRSICAADWTGILNDIGASAAGLKVQFFLSRPPVPESLLVKVNGNSCATGWSYEEDTGSIVFDPSGACMPQPSQAIELTYDVECQP